LPAPAWIGGRARADLFRQCHAVGVNAEAPRLLVRVDQDKCQGHNRCYSLAPELFDIDDLGTSHERNDGAVPAGLEQKARRAVANCPEYAISVSELGSAS
jgi:ferredoxin